MKTLTADEFRQLSFEEQEIFINDGGNVVNSPKPVANTTTASETVATSSSVIPVAQDEAKESSDSPPIQFDEDAFDFTDPVELLVTYNDSIASGRTILHDWQVQFMLDFANEYTKEKPFLANVRACNGSGKDMYVVAACLVWLCMKYKYVLSVATNGSGNQLDNQTERHIRNLCQKINAKHGGEVWKCNYRYYKCLPTQSEAILFATDEPLKAEGFHPTEDGKKMAIFASEAKSIPDEIFTALARCNGFTHRVNVSSPGLQRGYFYNRCTESVSRKMVKDVKSVPTGKYIEYHITAYDCPHITKSEIETMASEMPGGRLGVAFKSAVDAEFGSGDVSVVIPYTYVWISTRYKTDEIDAKWVPEPFNKGGLDLADGGAETVLVTRNGNRMLHLDAFKFDNSEDTVAYLEEKFVERKLVHRDAYIFGDCIGIGKPILDRLKRKGWSNIRYIDSRASSNRPKTYKNYNAQAWFTFAEWMKNKELILLPDNKLISQLSNRLYKFVDGLIHQMLSKIEMRNKGIESPDRADATILAFTDYKSNYISPNDNKPIPDELKTEEEEQLEVVGSFDLKSWAKNSQGTYGRYQLYGPKELSELHEAISELNSRITKG